MRKTRIAIIGAGLAATPHALALNELRDDVEVACVTATGRSREQLETFARTHGFPIGSSPDEALSDTRIDAVLILTPPSTHLELVQKAVAAHKHVLLEKPLEISTDRAERLVAMCVDSRVKLGIVFQNRFRPAVRKLAAIMKAGELGKLAYAGVDMRWWRPQSYYDEPGRGTYARDGGGVLLTQAIHALDILMWLAGDVASFTSMPATTVLHAMEAEDFVSAGLTFESGAAGHVLATTGAFPGFPERIEFVGLKGTAVLNGGHLQVFYQDGRADEFKDTAATGFGARPMDFSHTAHRELLHDFVNAIRENRNPSVTGNDALRVQKLIERMSPRPERV
ncbi:Gfo/Idh/MocA family oxidoreductase [Caballeronia sp. LjRoot34]|uniref:Gfo/Idh/MocA family protein n=1 Tax=Caballeronia sp. LjRoot34 TaxID=3342325 RepID=UPI003ECC5160